jgi:hypothetical protein
MNGYHQNPFRIGAYKTAPASVDFALNEIWRVQTHTFKNEAIVMFGVKEARDANVPTPIPGKMASENGLTTLTFYRNVQGRRTAWSEQDLSGRRGGFFEPANFRQGVDVMPRTLFFHELSPGPVVGGVRQWNVRPIDTGSSPLSFAIRDAKKCTSFRLTQCVVPDTVVFDVLISNLLTPFEINAPLKALLPIRKNTRGIWEPLDATAIAAKGSAVVSAFNQMANALLAEGEQKTIWDLLNTRGKLEQQLIRGGGYIVFSGTSGSYVCSAYMATDGFDLEKLIVDQTLNWARVETEDEAIYLTGMLNSEAVNRAIEDFQPEGAFGPRHIHSLPFGVTPPFNPTDESHQQVVTQTKRLMAEYENLKAHDSALSETLNPNRGTLAQRRSAISKMIELLPAYTAYSEACDAVYGV